MTTAAGSGAPERIPDQMPAVKSSRKPPKGRAPVTGRPVSNAPAAPRQQQAAKGAEKAAAHIIGKALVSPNKAIHQTVTPQPSNAPKRAFDPSKTGIATPFTVPQSPQPAAPKGKTLPPPRPAPNPQQIDRMLMHVPSHMYDERAFARANYLKRLLP